MFYAGIDLHKKTIRVCVCDQQLKIVKEKTLACGQPDSIAAFFAELRPFTAVVEATASDSAGCRAAPAWPSPHARRRDAAGSHAILRARCTRWTTNSARSSAKSSSRAGS